MKLVLLFALLGLGTGALIAGIALGVVLTYRGSGIINLATGAVAMVAGYAFWSLKTGFFGFQLGTLPALAITLVVATGVGALMEVGAFRPLRTASPLAKLAASLGILLTAQAAMLLGFGTTVKAAPPILPSSAVAVVGLTVPVDRFILAGAVIVIAVGLAALYRWSRFGLATRAASENEVAAMLVGLSPNQLSMVNTLLASLVAGLMGVLAASLVQLNSTTLPLQIVPALAAALFARFTSFGIACAAGLLIGIAQSLMYYASTQSWFPTDQGNPLPGIQQLLVFLIIIIAMFWRGASLPGRGELVERRLPSVPLPERLLRSAVIAGVVCVVALIVFPYDFRQALITSLIGAIIVMSFVVITGYVGQISVVQLALSGVAGFTLSHLVTDAGIGFPLGPIIAVAVTTLLGVLVAVSALRVRGVSLAVVTLAAALAMEQFIFVNSTWGGGSGGSPAPSPHLFGVNLGPTASFRGLDGDQPSAVFGFLVLAVTLALGVYVANLRRTSLGRRMIAVRANERAAAAAGVHVRNVKLIAFGLSSFVAGVAGTLYAYNFGSISATRFSALTALGLIAFAYIGGITMVSGAVLAGLISTEALFPHAFDKWFGISGNWALLVGGLALIITLRVHPEGIAGANYQRKQRRRAAGRGSRLKAWSSRWRAEEPTATSEVKP
ncbi:MAG: branched-chain amino acid ABC transporter permease [Streptosporangiales bacterium]|nr:branched-chain amino acid ABC transporter permease [Streptosporangiales bacterium]